MRSFARRGWKLFFALGMAGLSALALSRAAPARADSEGGRSAPPSTTGIRLAARPTPSKPAKAPKPAKEVKPKEKSSSRNKKSASDSSERVKEPTTFAEAFERGKQSLDEAQAAILGIDIAKNQEAVDPAILAQLAEDKQRNERAAMADFRLALALAGKASGKDRPDAEQLNTARFYVCYLFYDGGEYYDAAVIGDFLARHATDKTTAAGVESYGFKGAQIVLASYINLFRNSKQTDKSFEAKKIREAAEYILAHWPDQAEDAALSLLNFALADRRLDDALGYLNRIPADSPRRGQSDLFAGQALWAAYLKAVQAPADERPPQEELDRFKSQARQVLRDGFERIEKQGVEPTDALADGMLALAQVYLDNGEGQLAVATLENPTFGPLTLVEAGSPLVKRPGFAVETYKVAVRAYIAQQQIAKAKTVMDALDKAVVASGDPAANEMLTSIYVSLGRELQQQLERMRKDASQQDLQAVSDAFETFLSRISSRQTGTNYNSLSWVAETLYGLAAGLDDPAEPAKDPAKTHYKHAAEAYRQILVQAARDPKFVPDPNTLLGVQLRMAVSLRRIGDFDEAIKLIVEVLKQHPTMITAQIAAAETLAAQGEVEREGYMRSILGTSPDQHGHNLIWGWAILANKTQGNPQFEETFYRARLKIAEARLLYGLKVTDPAIRAKTFESAKNDLWKTFRLYPNLGGPQSSAEYDLLLKRIQQQLHQPLDGLREFKEREAAGGKDPDKKDKSA
jgi:tetratricopeptide (TPR) repeat protein